MFQAFFERENTVSLGICNGWPDDGSACPLIPDAKHFKPMARNASQQFEARLALATLPTSRSVLLRDLEGTRFPIAVAHGEGRFQHTASEVTSLLDSGLSSLLYADDQDVPKHVIREIRMDLLRGLLVFVRKTVE